MLSSSISHLHVASSFDSKWLCSFCHKLPLRGEGRSFPMLSVNLKQFVTKQHLHTRTADTRCRYHTVGLRQHAGFLLLLDDTRRKSCREVKLCRSFQVGSGNFSFCCPLCRCPGKQWPQQLF